MENNCVRQTETYYLNLYIDTVEGCETETLKYDLMQQCSESSYSVALDFYIDVIIFLNDKPVNDILAHISELINHLDKVIRTKSD